MSGKRGTTETVLLPELVPAPLWGKSLSRGHNSAFRHMRLDLYEEQQHKCAVCGVLIEESRDALCHEVWDYDDKRLVQRLKGFQILCRNCSSIKHLGQLSAQVQKGLVSEEDFERIVQHALTVNGISREVFEIAVSDIYLLWLLRSEHKWTQDMSYFERYETEYTDLKAYIASHPDEVARIAAKHGMEAKQ